MSYQLENLSSYTKKLVFDFPTLDLSADVEERLKQKQKTTAIKGFRKGHVPMNMVKDIFGGKLEVEALEKFIEKSIFEAIQKENIKVIGQPELKNVKYEDKKNLSFDVFVENLPEVELPDLSEYAFVRDKIEVTEEDINQEKKRILESKAELTPLDEQTGVLEKGHHSIINFVGERSNGERPDSMKGSDMELEIGAGKFIPGFEEGMIGMKVGEKRKLNLTFPENYHQKDLQNEVVVFEVELLEIKERKLPEINEEFLKSQGYDSEEDMMEKIKKLVESNKNHAADEKLKKDIIDKLVENYPEGLPSKIMDAEKQRIENNYIDMFSRQGMTKEMALEHFAKESEVLMEESERQIKSMLIFDHLAIENNISITDSEVEEMIFSRAKEFGIEGEKFVDFYHQHPEEKNRLVETLKEKKIMDYILGQVKVS
jgi:trigger factor